MEASIQPDPVAGGDDAIASYRAEDGRAQYLPLLRVVKRVDLSREHGQNQSKNCHQVDLTPQLRRAVGNKRKPRKFKKLSSSSTAAC